MSLKRIRLCLPCTLTEFHQILDWARDTGIPMVQADVSYGFGKWRTARTRGRVGRRIRVGWYEFTLDFKVRILERDLVIVKLYNPLVTEL